MLPRSFAAKLSASYFHGFLSVQHAVSLLLSEAFLKLFPCFPFRPACCLAPSQRPVRPACCLAPSQRSFPQAISTVLLSVQHAVSLLPSEAFLKLFPCFPFRPACCLAPSQRPVVSVQHAASLLPSEALRKLFPRFPFRPPLVLAPPEANEKLNENPSIGDAFGKNEDPSCAEAGNRNPCYAFGKMFAHPSKTCLQRDENVGSHWL